MPKGDGVQAVRQESKNPLQKSRVSPASAARGTNIEAEQNIQLDCWSNHYQGNHVQQRKLRQHPNHEHRPTTQQHPILQVFLQWCLDPDMHHQICRWSPLELGKADRPGLVVVFCGIERDNNAPTMDIAG